MPSQSEDCQHAAGACRRRFLGASFAATTSALLGAGTFSGLVHADAVTKAKRDKMTPDDIIALMKKGNKRFSGGRRMDHNYLAQQRATASGQYPLAVLLSCID